MKRATITIPDDLEADLERWLRTQSARPSLTAVIQAALRSYLELEQARERSPGSTLRYQSPAAAGTGGVAEPTAGHEQQQVSIPSGVWEHARRRAASEGVSMEELCERAIVHELEGTAADRPWMELAGVVDIDDPQASSSIDEVVYGREQP